MNKRLVLGCGIILSLVACESKFTSPEVEMTVIDPGSVEDGINSDSDQQVSEAPLMNHALTELDIKLSEDHMGVVIHNPSDAQLNSVEAITYTVEPVEEGFLFIPKVIGTQIQIYEVSWEEDKLVSGDLLFEEKDLQDREALYLQCPVPEGIPMLKVVIEDDEQRVEYIITYDGSGMRDQIEFLIGEID